MRYAGSELKKRVFYGILTRNINGKQFKKPLEVVT